MSTENQKIDIILDCDPGYDDAAAILLAAGNPNVNILAITVVAGNQSIAKVTRNALAIAQVAGLHDVPIAAGATRPLMIEPEVAAEIHGETGLDDATLPEEIVLKTDPRHAVQVIIDTVMSRPAGTVTLVPTGPLTNIALAARLEPRIVERVKEVVLMGGAVHTGNHGPYSEFNIGTDPEAADIVFKEKWKVVMVGLDLTYQARVSEEQVARIAAIPTTSAKLLAEILTAFNVRYRRVRGFGDAPLHDPCAIACVLDPTVVRYVPVPISVELTGTRTRGMTVADFRRTAPEGCHTHAALELDLARFWDMMADAVSRLP